MEGLGFLGHGLGSHGEDPRVLLDYCYRMTIQGDHIIYNTATF